MGTFKMIGRAAVAALLLVSCAKEAGELDRLPIDSEGSTFLNVNIRPADAITKGDAAGFEDGEALEGQVNSADFYFFDVNGAFVTKANVWNGGSEDYDKENIEYIGQSVIVLKNLTTNSNPRYMVTVLNAPNLLSDAVLADNFTLAKMEKCLSNTSSTQGTRNGGTPDGFIMTTTSVPSMVRAAGTPDTVPVYFATTLSTENFQSTAEGASTAPAVTVYVERLACKVTLEVKIPETPGTYTLSPVKDADNHDIPNLYKMKVTVAGEENGAIEPGLGAEYVYVRFTGFQLNAKAAATRISKNIDTNWIAGETAVNAGDVPLGFAWLPTTGYVYDSATQTGSASATGGDQLVQTRSYWGKGVYYDEDYNADNYVVASNASLTGSDAIALGDPAYCAENTHAITDNYKENFSKMTTSVLVGAQILRLNDGVTEAALTSTNLDTKLHAPTLVRYNGIVFTGEWFIKYCLNNLKATNSIPYWYKKTVEGVEKLYQIDETFITLEETSTGSGKVKMVVDDTKVSGTGEPGKVTFYKRLGTGTEADPYRLDETAPYSIATINTALAASTSSQDAIVYEEGFMYYNIPIEHLRAGAADALKTTGLSGLKEGHFGVVRNHHYRLSISGIRNLGHGIYDPDSEVPGVVPDEPSDDPLYSVSAQINILAWQVVEQPGIIL